MFAALLYLQFVQTGNRLVARLRRLRQPKYLLGAIVGGLYFYFNFFRYLLFDRSVRAQRVGAAVAVGSLGIGTGFFLSGMETLGAIFLLALSLVTWLLPNRRAALVFSEAEIAFLFPAPISRRALIHFRLLRSQLAILFSIVILTLLTGRFRASGSESVFRQIIGWWVLLSTLSLHNLALSFARSLLLERGISNWRRRVVTLAIAAALLGGAIVWARGSLSSLDLFSAIGATDATSLRAVLLSRLQILDAALHAPPLNWVLWPFRVPLRPFLATDFRTFGLAIGPALGLLAAHYAWIVRADVAFEEASLEVSRRHAERLASLHSGKGGRSEVVRRRRDPFHLRPAGLRLIGIVWKNMLAAGPFFNLRILGTLVGLFGFVFLLVSGLEARRAMPQFLEANRALAPIAGAIALEFFLMILLFGSQMVRNDLRQDLANVELLKTYPLPGWQIALAEVLAPTLLLTLLQWALLLGTLTLFSGDLNPTARAFGVTPRISWAFAVGVIAPPFNFLSLTIPNAAVLLLPAWFQSGPNAPQGVEVMGQRLIFFLGQFFVLAVTLVPAAGTGLAVYFATRYLGGSAEIATVIAPLAGALVLIGEGAFALYPLGRWFEKLDVSAESETR